MAVMDLDPGSNAYGSMTARVDMPGAGDELHHFGWNACSSCLCPYSPHPHMERRYLVVPGLRSSRIHIVDTKPDPRAPRLVKVIEGDEVMAKTGYSRPHTSHCGPDGIYMNALGNTGRRRTGRHLRARSRDVRDQGRVGARSRPAAPGLRLLVAPRPRHDDHQRVGHAEHGEGRRQSRAAARRQVRATRCTCGTCTRARHLQKLDLGAEQQMVLELRPAHNPTEAYGFVGVVTQLKDLSASVWLWYRDGRARGGSGRSSRFPAEPADAGQAPAAAQGIRRGAAARDRHQPLARRSLPLRVVLGHGRAAAVRRVRSVQPGRDRVGAASAASCGARRTRASRTGR